MLSSRNLTRLGFGLAVAAGLAFSGVVGGPTSLTEAKASPPAQDAGGYAGEDACLMCHEDQKDKGTAHGRAFNARTPAALQRCESCHGPGQAHIDAGGDIAAIVNPAKLSPDAASDTCTTCHNREAQVHWEGSQHDSRQIGCLSCHSAHAPVGEPMLKAKDETSMCATCHKPIVNKQMRFNHMPVREGRMECSSCHNVHGSSNVKLLKAGSTVDESCWSCHADKRGPFLWDHAPVSESCTTCHDPHGSNNDRMLVAKQPFLCQRCHVTARHPPTIYDGYLLQTSQNANKIYGRSCVVCHQTIHGSNAPSGKTFLR